MSKKLVIVADDFGLSKGVNNGIIRAYTQGIVTEISLMVDAFETEDAVTQLKEHKIEDVGLHMMLVGISSGKFFRKGDYEKLFLEKSSDEIKKLALKELELFENLVGRKPTHICPQNGIHGNLKLLTTVIEFAMGNDIAVRIPDIALTSAQPESNYAAEIMLKRSNVRKTDHLFSNVLGAEITKIKKDFMDLLLSVQKDETAEIVLHPGYFTEELIGKTSLLYERSRDLALSIDTEMKDFVCKKGYKLVSYSKL